jgi:hypothetical protein
MQDEQVVLMTRGDARSGPNEQIRPKQVLGRVVSVQRGKKVFHVNQGAQRVAALVWIKLAPLSLMLIRLLRRVKQMIF